MLQYFAQQKFVSPLGMQEEPELLYISRTDAQEDALYPRAMHRHDDCFEMLLIEKGNGVISIDGRDYTVHAGDLVLYNCGVMHDEDARPKHRFSRYCIAFGALQLPGMRENCFLPTGACPVLPSGRSFEILLWSFRMIFEMMSMRRSENEAAAHYLALFILSTVGGLCRENAAAGEQVKESSDQIDRIRAYIADHYQQQISLAQIAAAVSLSPSYLSHLFCRAAGCSPMQYVAHLRLGRAQVLLIQTGMPVSDIAFSVGYNNVGSFNYAFLKFAGCSPTVFRRTYASRAGTEQKADKTRPAP